MKSKVLISSALLLSAGAITWAAKDPVVLTVGGQDVPRSEFEYLYHKNSQQQLEPLTLDEYVGMFELYKMKVADAKSEGIDTTASFRQEMAQYRYDLAIPYLADSVYLNHLVDEAYALSQFEPTFTHIVFARGMMPQQTHDALHKADSIHAVLKNGGDFAELAREYSQDRMTAPRGGNYGYMSSGHFPYSLEKVVFNLQPGEISEVIESPMGYHIFLGGDKRPARGSVKAAHIMKMLRPGASEAEVARVKAQADSIYAKLRENPELFEELARTESQDQSSGRNGGVIGWFSAGDMVPEFSEATFDMAVGEISAPVQSAYGFHIIKKLDEKGPRTREEMKPELLRSFNDQRDDRYALVMKNRDNNLAKKHKAKYNTEADSKLRNFVENSGIDSTFYSTFSNDADVLISVGNNNATIKDFVASLGRLENPDPYMASKVLDNRLELFYDRRLVEAEEDWLYKNNADYRNLLNEYYDGSLLYEISLRRVWNRASEDTEGLENYFRTHKAEYTFSGPRAKGILVQAKNDSVADLIKARYATLDKKEAVQTLKSEFRSDAVVDRMLAPQGLNKIVDFLMFDGPEAEPNAKFPVYFILDGRIIDAPEDVTDVKGQVTSDYQTQLEQDWHRQLRAKYPVVRNPKVIKTIK